MSLYVAKLPWHPLVRKYVEDHQEILRILKSLEGSPEPSAHNPEP